MELPTWFDRPTRAGSPDSPMAGLCRLCSPGGGLRDVLPDLSGAQELWGRGLLQYPYCHGWEVRDQALGVLASSPTFIHEVLLVRQWSDDVTFFPHTSEPLSLDDEHRFHARSVPIIEGRVSAFALKHDDAGLPLLEALSCDRRDAGCADRRPPQRAAAASFAGVLPEVRAGVLVLPLERSRVHVRRVTAARSRSPARSRGSAVHRRHHGW